MSRTHNYEIEHLDLRDTAVSDVSLAIGDGQEPAVTRSIELRQSSERLLRHLREALTEANVQLSDLGGIAVLQGPGSFTGLRIGVTVARTMAWTCTSQM